MKKQLGALDRIFPMPCVLVVGGTWANADALAVAWINIVSSTPPTIAMGLRESRRTLELIHESGSFTVNVPSAKMAAEVDFFGLVSGRAIDKFSSTGLSLLPGTATVTPIIEQCPFNLECRVVEEVPVGAYRLVLGEIVEAHADDRILKGGDGTAVDMDKLDPLVYCAGVREYRKLGKKVADAFSVGKSLMSESE
jgi:flavin reductase (DIM6/NTAB) family NADH-FMN oxidoreductase RutF